jgi:NIPSNAP
MFAIADDVCVDIAETTLSPIVELRQYTLHPGKRDVLIELFDRALIESQEELDMTVIGQFRDVDDLDRFVWLRGFRDMTTRAQSLRAFYGGPVWKANRDAANATMIDSDNVLLLRPARTGSGFSIDLAPRPPRGATGSGPGLVVATIYSLEAGAESAIVEHFNREVVPAVMDRGGVVLALFVSEPSVNTFPALPIRENENVFVWFAGFGNSAGDIDLSHDHAPCVTGPPQVLRLVPTARSRLNGTSPACHGI